MRGRSFTEGEQIFVRRTDLKSGLIAGLVGVLVAGALAVPAITAEAATPPPPRAGVLAQLPGATGCVQDPVVAADGCAAGRGLAEAGSTAMTSDGQFVYVAGNTDGGSIAVFRRDTVSGALTQLAGTAGCVSQTGSNGRCAVDAELVNLRTILLSPNNNTLYVASISTGKVLIFSRATDGSLSRPDSPAGCINNGPASPTCSAGTGIPAPYGLATDGNNLFVSSVSAPEASGSLARFDVRSPNPVFESCAQSDQSTPPAAPCAPATGLPNATGVAVSGSNVYVSAFGLASAGALSVFDARGTVLMQTKCFGPRSGCDAARGIGSGTDVVVSADSKNVYVASQDLSPSNGSYIGGGVAVFGVDGATLTQLDGAAGCIVQTTAPGNQTCTQGRGLRGTSAITLPADGRQVYTASSLINPSVPETGESGSSAIAVLDRDPSTGALTQAGGADGCVSAISADGCTVVRGLRSPGHRPRALVVSPKGDSLYAGARFSNAVSSFTRHGSDLRLSAVAPDQPYTEGQQATLTVTAFNAGPLPATNTVVTDFITGGATVNFANPSPGGSCSTPPVTCTFPTVPVDGAVTVTVTFTPTAVGTAVNTARATSDNGDVRPADNTATTNLQTAGPGLTVVSGAGQSAPVLTPFGAPLKVSLRNGSNQPVAGAQVTFTTPATGASASFANSNTETTLTDARGVATSSFPVANAETGTYNVTASTSITDPVFLGLTNAPGPSPSASASATPSGSATPSTTPSATPSATPSTTPSATPSATPSSDPCSTAIAASRNEITIGDPVTVTVAARPGSRVKLEGYSRPASTYAEVRPFTTVGSTGTVVYTVNTATNTRVRPVVEGCSPSTLSELILVHPVLTLKVVRNATRDYTFSGLFLPRVQNTGRNITLYYQPTGAAKIRRGIATVGSDGTYRVRLVFSGSARLDFFFETGNNTVNQSARSNVRSLLIY